MDHTAALVALATSVPPHQFQQNQILDVARGMMADRYPEFDTLSSLFANTGIRHRYGVKPIEWYQERRGWPERTQAFLEGAEALFVDVARKALARAGVSAGEIDTVVTVCSTGIATRLAQSRPGTNVLLVALELCTLAVRHDELTKANVVAASLFGDGAAAVVLRAGDGGVTRVEASGEKLWPDTLDIMGWSVDPEGFGVIFQRTIPDFVQEHMGPAVAEMVGRMNFPLAEIDRFVCHPGGAKVIAALERALALEQGALDHEREVIADYGNMSAPTVLFVLERALAQGLPPRSLLTALGPGFTASCVALRHAA